MLSRPEVCCADSTIDSDYLSRKYLNFPFLFLVSINSQIAPLGLNSVYYTDGQRLRKFQYHTQNRYGSFNDIEFLHQGGALARNPFSCISTLGARSEFLAAGQINSGVVKLFDLNVCQEIRRFALKDASSTALHIKTSHASESLLLVSDNNCSFTLFDIRDHSRIGAVNFFKGSNDLPLSLDFEDHQLLLGSSEGPITYDLKMMTYEGQKEDKTQRTKLEDQGVYHKAIYAGTNSHNIVYC